MIVWPAKDPVEVLDFTWEVPLDEGDTIASFTATVTAGAITKDNAEATESDTKVTVWLSGGADGEVGMVNLIAITEGGRTFRESAVLAVVDRASELLAKFRLRYPALSALADGAIGYWFGETVHITGNDPARLALAAHHASLGAPTAIPAGVTSFRSGSFSATVSDSVAGRTGLSATIYGCEYLDLMRGFAGPIMAWTPPTAVYP
jgi:hypothetical protein